MPRAGRQAQIAVHMALGTSTVRLVARKGRSFLGDVLLPSGFCRNRQDTDSIVTRVLWSQHAYAYSSYRGVCFLSSATSRLALLLARAVLTLHTRTASARHKQPRDGYPAMDGSPPWAQKALRPLAAAD